jgi:ectoine hydroxylase-related dioxygenase (phytanoyl-CoA dioxygenase family)
LLDFERDGACILAASGDLSDIVALRNEFSAFDFKAGARSFELSTTVKHMLLPDGVFGVALAALNKPRARPVRVLAFDKTPLNNWNLGWHQDRVIAVKARIETPGFSNWTIKNGVHHVQPPADFMQGLFTLRLHLDDCDETNGALKVICGSHRMGKLLDAEVHELGKSSPWEYCRVKTGEVLAMKTLAVHSSSPSENPSHRRVLHIDFCEEDVPNGLEWALVV